MFAGSRINDALMKQADTNELPDQPFVGDSRACPVCGSII